MPQADKRRKLTAKKSPAKVRAHDPAGARAVCPERRRPFRTVITLLALSALLPAAAWLALLALSMNVCADATPRLLPLQGRPSLAVQAANKRKSRAALVRDSPPKVFVFVWVGVCACGGGGGGQACPHTADAIAAC